MYALNDIIELKKPHACGGKSWVIARVGAELKLQCQTCGRYRNVTRDELRKTVKNHSKESMGEIE